MGKTTPLPINLGKRKIIKNNNSCIMTIPSTFTNVTGIQAGDVVTVSMSIDGALMISLPEDKS